MPEAEVILKKKRQGDSQEGTIILSELKLMVTSKMFLSLIS